MNATCKLRAALVIALTIRAHAATPVPQVKGPLPVTADSYPFGAADHTRVPTDLKKDGYVEEEFLVTGTANVYDWPQPGPAVVRTSGAPYTTRVLVRRPAQRSRFSGSVAVEMLNPSNLFDLNLGWAISGRQFVRNGDAWVGITAKPVAVTTLKNFNPSRYAALSWPNPLPLDDPRNCSNTARDSDRTTENGLVWDVNSQVAAWLKSRDRSNPLAFGEPDSRPHPVQHLYAWGYSQTGSFLYTYVNAIHPLDVRANGKPLFDAYVIAMSSGPSQINQCAAPVPSGDARRQIKDAGVPVVRVMSQSDYLAGIAARRADSDTAPDLYRNYEIAGAAHATPDELNFAAAPDDLVKAGRAVPPMACDEGPRSRFPNWVAAMPFFRTSTYGCAKVSRHRARSRSRWITASLFSTSSATSPGAFVRPMWMCRGVPGSAIRPGNRSAGSRGTKWHSIGNDCGSSIPPRKPMNRRLPKTSPSWWPPVP
jgi:hypothetical protein